MSTVETDPLFPLPLTPLEYYYLCDNRPDYPTAFPVELQFVGRLDHEALTRALACVTPRHPMLTARVAPLANGIPAWIDGDGWMPPVDWGHDGEPIGHADGAAIDLAAVPGLRIWVRESDGASRLFIQFHHACCDGWAAVQFIEDLLIAYHLQLEGPNCGVALRRLDPTGLRHRGRLETQPGIWPQLRDLYVGARFWTELALQQPALLAAGQAADVDGPLLDFQTVALNAETTVRLRRVAAAADANLHDLLLRDLFVSMQDWNLCQRRDDPRPIRINVPIMLRDRDDRLLPAANRLTFAFVSRRRRQLTDPARLLGGIAREMRAIRQYRLGLYFIGGLGTFCHVPGLIPWFLGRRRGFATAVFSFVGRLLAHTPLPRTERRLVVGNVVLDRIVGVPPIRPFTRAAIGAIIYGDQMTMSVRCDPQCFGRSETLHFAQLYQQRLEHTAAQRT